jgi:hypothetical protein
LGRVILLPVAFVIAALVTLYVIFSLGSERAIHALAGRNPDEVPVGAAVDLMALARALFSVQTLVPAILLIIIVEVGRIRGALYYVIGGGAALAIVPLLMRISNPSGILELSPVVWQVLATAGFAGGFVYWVLAGRNA